MRMVGEFVGTADDLTDYYYTQIVVMLWYRPHSYHLVLLYFIDKMGISNNKCVSDVLCTFCRVNLECTWYQMAVASLIDARFDHQDFSIW